MVSVWRNTADKRCSLRRLIAYEAYEVKVEQDKFDFGYFDGTRQGQELYIKFTGCTKEGQIFSVSPREFLKLYATLSELPRTWLRRCYFQDRKEAGSRSYLRKWEKRMSRRGRRDQVCGCFRLARGCFPLHAPLNALNSCLRKDSCKHAMHYAAQTGLPLNFKREDEFTASCFRLRRLMSYVSRYLGSGNEDSAI